MSSASEDEFLRDCGSVSEENPPVFERQEGALEYSYVSELDCTTKQMIGLEWRLLYTPTCARVLAIEILLST